MSDIGKAIGDAIAFMVIAVGIVAFVLGGLLVWGLPKAWAWFKPILVSWLS